MDKVTDLSCRVCLNVEELMVNIYEEVEDLNSDLSSLLEECGGLKVDRGDCYPKYLCKECTSELLIAAKFREKCTKSKEIIQQFQTDMCTIEEPLPEEVTVVNESHLMENVIVEDLLMKDNLSGDSNTLMLPVDYISLSDVDRQLIGMDDDQIEKSTDSMIIESDEVEHEHRDAEDENILINNEENYSEIIVFGEDEQNGDIIGIVDTTNSNEDIPTNENEDIPTNPNEDIPTNHNEDIPLESEAESNKEVDEKSEKSNLSTPSLKFVCDICGAAFAHGQNLQRHMNNLHFPLQIYNCAKCSHCFSMEEVYSEHCKTCTETNSADSDGITVTRHTPAKETKHTKTCSYCNKECKSFHALEMHLRTHTGERPFGCGLCPKAFKTRSALAGHMKRHSGIPDYVCPYCAKTFYENSNLQTHLRTHTGEKPHSCTVCGKRFSRVFLLQLHMRTHTGEKPYACPLCERSFAQLCDVKNHIRTHTGERQYQCPVCPKSFIKRRPLLVHMQRHSSVDLNTFGDASQSTTVNEGDSGGLVYDELVSECIVDSTDECGMSIAHNLNDFIVEDL